MALTRMVRGLGVYQVSSACVLNTGHIGLDFVTSLNKRPNQGSSCEEDL